MKTLQDVFAENFGRLDLSGAKRWAHKWYREDNQEIPDLGHFSMRAMAGHLSDYLEGFTGDEPESYDGSGLNKVYLDTKYGNAMYDAMYVGDRSPELKRSEGHQQ